MIRRERTDYLERTFQTKAKVVYTFAALNPGALVTGAGIAVFTLRHCLIS